MALNSKFKMLVLSHESANNDQLQKIYDLNQANTPEVGSLESKKHLIKLIELSAYNLLILKGDEVIGFIICMREGSDYGSENYKFFSKKLILILYMDLGDIFYVPEIKLIKFERIKNFFYVFFKTFLES